MELILEIWHGSGLYQITAVPRHRKEVRAAAAGHDRFRRTPEQYPGRRHCGARRPAVPVLRGGHHNRRVSADHLHGCRCADRFRAAARKSTHAVPRRCCAVRNFCNAARCAGDDGTGRHGLHAEGGGCDRHHRRCRRPDGHLRVGHARAATARCNCRCRLFVHGAGPDHPAADHAPAHDRGGAQDSHGAAARRLQNRAHPVPDHPATARCPVAADGSATPRHARIRQPDA